MAVSEAVGVVDLRLGKTCADVGATKGSARSHAPRGADVERALGRIVPEVFHRNGRPILNFRNAWKVACADAGLHNRIPHDFRRTAVRNLERAGVPRSVAMKLTGHKTESVYRRYAIVCESDLAEGVARLERLHLAESSAPTTVPFPPSKRRRRKA